MQSPPEWPPELDALIASGNHHRLLMENEAVRVLETIIEPGEITDVHTHCWPAVTYFLSRSHAVRRDAHGKVTMDSREVPATFGINEAGWTPQLGPHTLENVGESRIHVVTVEIKNS